MNALLFMASSLQLNVDSLGAHSGSRLSAISDDS
jgi:hypothetical protein